MEGPFTVITLSQHTENDMTMWSMEVESEREALLETVGPELIYALSVGFVPPKLKYVFYEDVLK